MNRRRVALALLLLPATGFSQSQPNDPTGQCERLVLAQADAASNPYRPFSLDLQGQNGARLIYFGVHHTFDPADPQYVEMEKIWRELQPTEAFFEGTGTFIGETLTDALRQSGEPGLMRHLGSVAGVPTHSLEPTRDAEVETLLQKFSAEQLVLFYVTRSVVQVRDRRGSSGSGLDSVFNQQLGQIHNTAALATTLRDITAFRAAYQRWFPGTDPALASARWFDPTRTSADTGSKFFNDVNRASSLFRDFYMYRLLVRAWRPNVRIFAEVGRDHIPAQAAALKCALSP
jgi:hypothetical protein